MTTVETSVAKLRSIDPPLSKDPHLGQFSWEKLHKTRRSHTSVTITSCCVNKLFVEMLLESESSSRSVSKPDLASGKPSEENLSLAPIDEGISMIYRQRRASTPLLARNEIELSSASSLPVDRGNAILIAEQQEMIKKFKFPDFMKAVTLVIFITGNVFLTTNLVVGVSDSEQFNVDGSVRTVVQVACPLYFYYAGRSEAFVSTSSTFGSRLVQKTVHLLLPSILGLFVFVIPAAYWTSSWNACGFPTNGAFLSFFDAYFQIFECLGFDWLWILVASFLLFVMNNPFFSWVRKRYDECLEHNGYLHPIDSNYIFP